MIPHSGENTLFVHGVNYEQAKHEGKKFQIELVKSTEFIEKITAQIQASRIHKLAVDTISLDNYSKFTKRLQGKTTLAVQNNVVWELRKVKDEAELKLMRKAGELASEGIRIAYEIITSGIPEKDVAAEVEYAMRKKGSDGTAFDTIVASGIRSAFPHGGCTNRKIRNGDLVVVDVGAKYQNYCSDITRTIVVGNPSGKQKKIYELVKLAQEEAFQSIKVKAKTKVIDATARQIIRNNGFGEYFVHSLGHGIGLAIHEPPTLNPESKDELEIGNVVTLEPGIYIVGFGGIRIEDTVIAQKSETEKITTGPYTLTI